MAKLIYAAFTSLDGYVADETGNFDWAELDEGSPRLHWKRGSWSITPPEEIGRSPSGSKANRKDHSGTALTFRARARFRLLPTDAPRVGTSSSMLETKSLD